MSRNIVFEGWLTKSPPNRRIWRTRWRRRWFALRQSGELPGQYFLDYYADRNCRRLKGTIDLDLCEQVDAGLHMERNGQAPLNPNLRGSVFTIQTQRRTYHLEADCEAEMEKWVDAICRVCGLRATEDVPPATVTRHNALDTYQNNISTITTMSDHYESADGTGPYIPISECITGVRAADEQRLFTFEPKTIAMGNRNVGQQYTSQPHIRINSELSENDSNMSDEDDGSFHASHTNLHWAVTKTFTKLSVAPNKDNSEDGPPVPPRPPKTFAGRSRELLLQKDPFQGPKIQEPLEVLDNPPHQAQQVIQTQPTLQSQQALQAQQLLQAQALQAQQAQQAQQRLRVPRRMSQGAPSSPRQPLIPVRCPEEEEEAAAGHGSMQYCNLPSMPPAVDRNLKPRPASHSVGHINNLPIQGGFKIGQGDDKPDALQYLDLDLHTTKPPTNQGPEPNKTNKKVEITHGKSMSAVDTDAYKTVDFLKTEAFNITRQDAEASRSFQY
ncbi:hypothetical protein PYW07_000427 [Mythimna separata]|uniref:PH domain-containing protein n=1 Tax=Mythimna separata TaxID=271217 RepID=A0AAD8E0J0_MYTSE|nr:hypothetical protein PYW07_000427 [Mythimna separata]